MFLYLLKRLARMQIVAYFLEYNRYINLLGIGVVLAIAWMFSRHRWQVNLRLVAGALALQVALAFFILKTTIGSTIIATISGGIEALYQYAGVGISFLFGALAQDTGTAWGPIFAIKVLPVIIFFGAFMALLFHFGIVQKIVMVLGFAVRPLLGTTGAETLCAVANSFLGQTESPLLIKNYLAGMTKSELLVVMVSGM